MNFEMGRELNNEEMENIEGTAYVPGRLGLEVEGTPSSDEGQNIEDEVFLSQGSPTFQHAFTSPPILQNSTVRTPTREAEEPAKRLS